MEITDDLLSVFTGRVEQRNGDYVFEVPEREIDIGDLAAGETYRVAVTTTATGDGAEQATGGRRDSTGPSGGRGADQPPVEEGEILDVEIEDVGEQGDGLARVDRGYVVIVPDTTPGDRPTIEITTVRENVAFGEVVQENAVN